MDKDFVELLKRVEEYFGINFMLADVREMVTMSDLERCVRAELQRDFVQVNLRTDDVWPALVEITANELGVPEEEIELTTRFSDDLNCG